MKYPASFITRHRRLLLIALLSVTLLLCSEANRLRLQEQTIPTSLPVIQTDTAPVAAFAASLDNQHARDVAALSALISRADVDARTRDDAAAQLLSMVTDRERQFALEEALSGTSLAPCTAVVTHDAVTLVTAKAEVTPEESALAISLAAVHCGVKPENVRIITAQ